MFRKYKGCVGSVRDIDCNLDNGCFASVGLDRFLRVYNVNSKKLVQKMYLKSRLNGILLTKNFDPNESESDRVERSGSKSEVSESVANNDSDSDIEEIKIEDEENQEDQEDVLWNNMKVVGAKKRKDEEDPFNKPVIGKKLAKKRKQK